MRVAVFGRRRPIPDPTLDAVIIAARARGHDTVVLDIADFVSGPVAFRPHTGSLHLGGVHLNLDDLDVMLLGPLPSAFARTAPAHVIARADEHDARQKAQAARHHLAWSIACDVEARGIPVLSSPTRARPADAKPLQLALLARAGVAVPDTLVADHDNNDQNHDDDNNDVISKPVVGGEVQVGRHLLAGVPSMVQPRLTGTQLRLAVVDGVVNAVGAIDFGDDDDDTGVVDVRRSAQAWRRSLITAELSALGRRCAAVCAFDICAIDVVATSTGLVVLDVNRTPQLMDLAAACDADIAGAVVDLLEARGRQRR